jgi:hypothetical protein
MEKLEILRVKELSYSHSVQIGGGEVVISPSQARQISAGVGRANKHAKWVGHQFYDVLRGFLDAFE